MLLLCAALTYLSAPALMTHQVNVAVNGDVGNSVIVLALGLVLGWLRPQIAFSLLLACQLPLYLFSVGGGLGSSIVVYLDFALMAVYCFRIAERRIAHTDPPPGTAAGACLLGVIFIQRSEEHTSELQSLRQLVCRLLLEKKYDDLWLLPFQLHSFILLSSMYYTFYH